VSSEVHHYISHPPRPVPLEALEDELIKLWRHPEQAQELGTHAVRACMANLIVFYSPAHGPADLDKTLIETVQRHPSRLIILQEEADSGSIHPEALVSTHLDQSHQVFCEQITLRAGQNGLERFPSLVTGLLLEDLPTSLWWASSKPLPHSQIWFLETSRLASQLIYDSFTWQDARQGIRAVTQWLSSTEGDQTAADLAWRRLKPWRRVIAQALDPALVPSALESIVRVSIKHGPHALPQAWLLAGWMAHLLGWQLKSGKVALGVEIVWQFESKTGSVSVACCRLTEGEYALLETAIAWQRGGRTCQARFRADDSTRITVDYEGVELKPRSVVLPQRTLGALVARQLSDFSGDPLFEQALGVAREMADALEQ